MEQQYQVFTKYKKIRNLLNNHYSSEGFSGQKHDMHEHGIEMTLAKRICMVQNILEHANTEICDVGEDVTLIM